jgi:hydrogenase nickel incorporation protein HypB
MCGHCGCGNTAAVSVLNLQTGTHTMLEHGSPESIHHHHHEHPARLMVLNKIDLLPHVEFDIERAANHARQVNPDIVILPISARTGQGLDAGYGWVRHELALSREAVLR